MLGRYAQRVFILMKIWERGEGDQRSYEGQTMLLPSAILRQERPRLSGCGYSRPSHIPYSGTGL
jgi:hypothetical protein